MKKNNLKQFWKKKDLEQKIFFIITIVFIVIDGFIIFNESLAGYRVELFFYFLIGQAVVKFILLVCLNKNSLDRNAIASVPYIGVLYSFIYFFKKPLTE